MRKISQIEDLSMRYIRHNVTPINGKNELLAFTQLMFSNCLFETMLGCYPTQPALTPKGTKFGLLPF